MQGFYLSVSVPFAHQMLLLWVCCCGPGEQMSISCSWLSAQHQPQHGTQQ